MTQFNRTWRTRLCSGMRRTCPSQLHLLSRAFITTFILGFRASSRMVLPVICVANGATCVFSASWAPLARVQQPGGPQRARAHSGAGKTFQEVSLYCIMDAQKASRRDSFCHNCTVLVTLLRCVVNCTAYPIQELCGPFPQKQGLGLKGLGWRFLTLTERALKE